MNLPKTTQGLSSSVDAVSVTILVASALGAGEKTEKRVVRECIKAVKSRRMHKAACQVLKVSPSQCCST